MCSLSQLSHWELLSAALPDNLQDKRVLDFGCGTGELAQRLIEKHKAEYVIAVDCNQSFTSTASSRLSVQPRDRFTVVCGDAFKIAPSDFNIVIFNPPMVPDEAGFERGGRWCLETFWKWLERASSCPIAYVMIFDYCLQYMSGNECIDMISNLETRRFKCELLMRHVRVVPPHSPILHHEDIISRWFPKFGYKIIEDGKGSRKRALERIVLKISR